MKGNQGPKAQGLSNHFTDLKVDISFRKPSASSRRCFSIALLKLRRDLTLLVVNVSDRTFKLSKKFFKN